MTFKIAFFSDTHLREDLVFPDDIDIFFHCGDMLNKGSMAELLKASSYFKEKLNGRKLYYTAGNHDNILQGPKAEEAKQILKDAGIETFVDSLTTVKSKGHSISCYFMPWVPETVPIHSFNLEDELRKKYIDQIPNSGIDILITHGPPDYILDAEDNGSHFGDHLLNEKIKLMEGLKIHAFGHVHGGRGTLMDNGVLYVNSACGSRAYKPIVVEYPSLEILT